MRSKYVLQVLFCGIIASWFAATAAGDAWNEHNIQQLNGTAASLDISADAQIVTESWNRTVAVPSLVYMPEQDRLLMSINCDYPHQAMVMTSDDRGVTWSTPTYLHVDSSGNPDTGMGIGLTYLGDGKAILSANYRWLSNDYGSTWTPLSVISPKPDGQAWYGWDPMLVDRDPQSGVVTRLIETGYGVDWNAYYSASGVPYSQGYMRSSTNQGVTWTTGVAVPQWLGANEVNIIRAANNDLVAACRTDVSYAGQTLDHYEGLGISISKDDGATWSNVEKLYDSGRHHPSLVLMPNNDLVMTYVVRKGYPDTPQGYPQFGIEAVVSRDNGVTWDMEHRYILDTWVGNRLSSDPNSWWASSQSTSTVLLPDGSLMTAFGTGYRSQQGSDGLYTPRDVGLIHWRLTPEVTLGLVDNGCPETGLHSYTLTATGTGITSLSKFTIDGEIHQVFNADGSPSEWRGDGSAIAAETSDSHVIFGNMRLPDLCGQSWDNANYPDGPPNKVTEETISGGGNSGMGTLNNFDDSVIAINDIYMKTGPPATENQTLELMQLVVADGKGFSIDLTLLTSRGYDLISGKSIVNAHNLSFSLASLQAGDANGDGRVDSDDAKVLAQHWQQNTGATWADGDFNRDGAVNDADAALLAANWLKSSSVGSASVPEPATPAMLIGLMLVGAMFSRRAGKGLVKN